MPTNWTPRITLASDQPDNMSGDQEFTPFVLHLGRGELISKEIIACSWVRSKWRAIRAGIAAMAERRRELREERRAQELLATINRRAR